MLRTRCITIISAALLMGASSLSLAEDSGMEDINSYTCKDIMRMTGDDRSISIGYLHGYWMGKSGKTKFNKEKAMAATDSFVDYCLDNPTDKAVSSMGKFAK